ncbi:unnamed protein product [Miscanthus lutarioriparius]|uniref:DUF4005 domain-containing protein n=1 Tax=Miscanthus lutarioriparius TaxID=422564 RepID=A0A811R010_9POAL|nr:unnamed protein product [Miscanthus lutarioriparius]
MTRQPVAAATVLPSPISWQSRYGRLDTCRPASPSPLPSPKRLAKASEEEYYTKAKRSSPYRSLPSPPHHRRRLRSSSTVYHPATESRMAAAKSFKEELQHHSMRGRGEDHYSSKTSSISISAYNSSNFLPAKPRSSFDGGSSSSVSIGKSGERSGHMGASSF